MLTPLRHELLQKGYRINPKIEQTGLSRADQLVAAVKLHYPRAAATDVWFENYRELQAMNSIGERRQRVEDPSFGKGDTKLSEQTKLLRFRHLDLKRVKTVYHAHAASLEVC